MSETSIDGIRLAKPGDLRSIEVCVRQAYSVYIERMGQRPAPMNASYAELIDDEVVHVIEAQGTLLGLIVMYRKAHSWFVENIAVLPSSHGQGLGQRLMQFAEAMANRQGLRTIELYTNEKMTENVGFYERLGYHVSRRVVEDGYHRVYFTKRLEG